MAFLQQVTHTRRVVLVHLAAMGFDVQLFAHGFSQPALRRGLSVSKRAADYTDWDVRNLVLAGVSDWYFQRKVVILPPPENRCL